MRPPRSGGGFPAIWYTIRQARGAGGLLRMWRSLRSRNACKTCALGMGGQRGGMVNEAGRFPEVCKKSVQAMAADMRGRIRPGFFDEFPFSTLERFSSRELEAAGRIVEPLLAEPHDAGYRAIGWDEAIERVAASLRSAAPERVFHYASGRSSNEAGFLFQLLARLHGSNNVHNCSFFCHNASGVGLKMAIGSTAGTVSLEDLDACDCLLVAGGNPASNHPRLMRTMIDLKRRGGQVIVVNPLRETGLVNFRVPSDVRSLLFGSQIADSYVQPHIGGDVALFTGVAKALLAAGAVDRAFIDRHVEGFDRWHTEVASIEWATIVERSGVDESAIRDLAERLARSRATVFAWTMGLTHHEDGVANVHAIANVALARGMIGRPGAGLLPLRGHSNIQGLGTVGVLPGPSERFLAAMESHFGVTLPRTPGLDTLGSLERAASGDIDAALALGGNLFGSAPDAEWTGRALNRIGVVTYLSTTLNTGHVRGRGRTTLILPVKTRDEESEPTTQESMFSYVRISDGGRARFEGPRGEIELLAAIGRAALGDRASLDFDSLADADRLRAAIAASVPGLAELRSAASEKREFTIPGRVLHVPTFATASGKATLCSAPLPARPSPDPASGSFRLMTIRSEGQFNTVVYEEEDYYRGQERRDVVLMHPDDLRLIGVEPDDRVRIESSCGVMDDVVVRPFAIRSGNVAMYYPEANVLVPAAADPRSGTPSFKNVPVRIAPSGRLPVLPTK